MTTSKKYAQSKQCLSTIWALRNIADSFFRPLRDLKTISDGNQHHYCSQHCWIAFQRQPLETIKKIPWSVHIHLTNQRGTFQQGLRGWIDVNVDGFICMLASALISSQVPLQTCDQWQTEMERGLGSHSAHCGFKFWIKTSKHANTQKLANAASSFRSLPFHGDLLSLSNVWYAWM